MITILTIICIIFVILIIKSTILIIKNKNKYNNIISLSISIFLLLISLGTLFGFKSFDKTNKENIIIKKKVIQILNKKTKHNKSKAYIYGTYLNSKNNLSKEKNMIKCINKFHKTKTIAICLKGENK